MRILIFRPGALGDALLTFPILRALKAQQPDIHITFVSNPAVLPLALVCGVADDVADFGDALWTELFSNEGISTPNLQQVFQETELAMCWLNDRDGLVEQNIRRVGTKQLIVAPSRPPSEQRMHIVEYLAQTIHLTLPESISELAPFALHETLMRRFEPSAPLMISGLENFPIAIHPGSGGAFKCWPSTSFAQLIGRLWQHRYPVLLLSGPADTGRVQKIVHSLPSIQQPDMLTHLEHAPLLEVAQALTQCRYYVGNDSGITHLASLLGVPTTALFGPSDPGVWRPVGASVQVIYEPNLERLMGDEVLRSILRAM
ncbi:MAG: glycosyltransferase family 9 protein, partial [Chloroflexota bacterium]|nr:glycosyltransferase family 9 protein [Chloroflexota bacterium]